MASTKRSGRLGKRFHDERPSAIKVAAMIDRSMRKLVNLRGRLRATAGWTVGTSPLAVLGGRRAPDWDEAPHP